MEELRDNDNDVDMLDASESSMQSPLKASDRQFAIWRNRVHREFEKCSASGGDALPVGVTLKSVHVDEARGVCVGEFHCFVPFQEGSDALSLIPLTALLVSMSYDPEKKARGDAQYPFLAPEVTIQHGSVYLPAEMIRKTSHAAQLADGNTVEESRSYSLVLPTLENWSPSNTLVMILHDFVATVQKYDPPVVSKALKDSGGAENGRPIKRMRMRKRDIVGVIHPCQEFDPITSTLVPTPMLLQTANIVLLVPPSAANAAGSLNNDPSYVYVSSLIPLKEIVRITPQRGKSITLFFRDRKLSCRTFLTKDTDAIVATIRKMIAATGGTKRGRDDDSNPLTQLLSYLSPEHSEKAKEMSSKFMGKLSKFASSMSRFVRGDDDEDAKQRDHEMFTSAVNETQGLKEAFYRTPSKDRMTEITRRYQSIAEEFALRKNAEGYVERAIEELQQFIEHPASKRILSETTVCEQFNRGIRVGPA